MSGTLDIKMLAALKPVSSLAPARLRELLDYSHLETIPRGQDPFKQVSLNGQSVYLLEGDLELEYEDGNHMLIHANSEWARYPLGKRQPGIARAMAVSDLLLLRIGDDVLDMIMTWSQFSPHEDIKPALGASVMSEAPAGVLHRTGSGRISTEYLASGPFASLPPANIGQLLEHLEAVAVWPDAVIIREGDEGDYYYIIESGRAHVTRMIGGVSMLLAELKPGDAFGEEALVSGARRNATVTMKSSGVLLRLKRQDFFKLMQEPLLHRIGIDEAMQKAAQGAIWIDVRHPSEYRYDKIPGAMNIPLNDIRSAIGALDRKGVYITYCQSGRRSSVAAFILARAGYDVYVLDGGIQKLPQLQQVQLAWSMN